MYNRILFIVLICAGLAGCSKKKNECQHSYTSDAELQGTWKDARESEGSSAPGTWYTISFADSSFDMTLHQRLDNGAEDLGHIKGDYQFDDNIIYFDGREYTVDSSSGTISFGNAYSHDFKAYKECNTLLLEEVGNISADAIIRLEKQ